MGKYSGNHPRYSGQEYDAREAYNKDLSDKARLHYLENSEHDKHAPKHCGPNHPAKMYGEDHAAKNLGFIKAETLKKDPSATTMQVDGETMPIKMAGDMGHNVLAEDMRSNQIAGASGDMGYAGDASGAPALMMRDLAKPALMMKKGIASMCGMKR